MTEQRRRTDAIDPWPSTDAGRGGGHLGALFLATVLGVGVGLLAAPQSGDKTRRALRKRIATVGEDLGEELEHLEKRSRPLRHAVRDRAEDLRRRGKKKYKETLEQLEELNDEFVDEFGSDAEEEDEGSGVLGTVLTLGAGLAAAYFLTSDRTASARERVREPAATVRAEAEAQWDRVQARRGGNGHPTTESGTRIDPADSAPQAS
jgi:gas vesicle protein